MAPVVVPTTLLTDAMSQIDVGPAGRPLPPSSWIEVQKQRRLRRYQVARDGQVRAVSPEGYYRTVWPLAPGCESLEYPISNKECRMNKVCPLVEYSRGKVNQPIL